VRFSDEVVGVTRVDGASTCLGDRQQFVDEELVGNECDLIAGVTLEQLQRLIGARLLPQPLDPHGGVDNRECAVNSLSPSLRARMRARASSVDTW
jgi:hypothetical protein